MVRHGHGSHDGSAEGEGVGVLLQSREAVGQAGGDQRQRSRVGCRTDHGLRARRPCAAGASELGVAARRSDHRQVWVRGRAKGLWTRTVCVEDRGKFEQERQPAAEYFAAGGRDDSAGTAGHTARHWQVAGGKWRGHLLYPPVDQVRRRPGGRRGGGSDGRDPREGGLRRPDQRTESRRYRSRWRRYLAQWLYGQRYPLYDPQ